MHKQMPKINHRLVSVFLFLKKSQISACFYSPILPKINGGLLMVVCGQFGIARATVYDGPNVFLDRIYRLMKILSVQMAAVVEIQGLLIGCQQ